MRLGEKNREIMANPEIGCSFLKNLCRWNMHLGCSARSGTVIKTVLRENHQIALFPASFVLAGPSLIQCNSRPVITRKWLERLDKDLKTNWKHIYKMSKTPYINFPRLRSLFVLKQCQVSRTRRKVWKCGNSPILSNYTLTTNLWTIQAVKIGQYTLTGTPLTVVQKSAPYSTSQAWKSNTVEAKLSILI